MTSSERIGELPLMERLKKAEYLARELSEHLTQAYLPKLSKLRVATKEFDPKEVSDQQVLDCTLAVLQAEDFTSNLYSELRAYLESIKGDTQEMLFGGAKGTVDHSLSDAQLEAIDGAGLFDD
jgi:predicted metal-dependent HD superfamily phosphohydrolase